MDFSASITGLSKFNQFERLLGSNPSSDFEQDTYRVLPSAVLTCIACLVLRQSESTLAAFLWALQNTSTRRYFVVEGLVELRHPSHSSTPNTMWEPRQSGTALMAALLELDV